MLSQRVDDDIELFLLMPHHAHEFFDLVETNRVYWSEWHPWVHGITDLASATRFIQRDLTRLAEGTDIRFGLRYQGRLVGRTTFSHIVPSTRKVEIGYQLDERHTGKGIITRAVRAMLNDAFSEWGMQKVEILCATHNTKSRAIPERLGFQHEGIIRHGDRVNGEYHDLVIYGLLAEEWKPA